MPVIQPDLIPAGDVGTAMSLLAPRPCRLILFEQDSRWPRRGAQDVERAMRAAYERAGAADCFDARWVAGKPAVDEPLMQPIKQWP